MRCVARLASIALLVMALGAGASARQKPNFSGIWVAVSPEAAAGQVQTVRQTETTLTRGHASSGGGHSFTYKLDGTDNHFKMHETATVATASWDGDKLRIVERTTYGNGRKRTATFVWSLSVVGELVVDYTEQFDGQPEKTMQIISRRRA